jgi:hypothetical protein
VAAIVEELCGLRKVPTYISPAVKEIDRLFHTATNFSGDLFKQELALDERLDAMIDRAVKRLIQIKAMKQMLGAASADEGQQKRIETKTARK